MSPTIQPTVTFGISPTYDTHIVSGNWVSPTQWVGTYNVTYYTGDGVQRLRVAGAVGADDGMEIPEDTRFTFTIATIGATSIDARPGYGYVALSWTPSDLPTVAGYNLYRSTTPGGPYTRLNPTVLTTPSYTDTNVTNGTTYYYVVKLLTTDLYEMAYGSETAATPNHYTAPTTPVVVDDGTCTPYTNRLHAAWSASDPDSGISEYQYSIGTWAGGTDVINWTSVGTSTEVTRTGLSLIEGVTYYFNVKARNGVGTWSSVGSSDGILVSGGCPAVDFTANPRSGYRPLSVQFTDQSVGSILAHLWDFGDGATSTLTNPLHTYDTTGIFTVTLTVTGSVAANTQIKPAYITVNEPPPVADFTASPRNGPRPLTVQFTDLSSGLIEAWLWDFGDGITSTLQSPTHTYAVKGVYTVTLAVNGPGGSDTETKAAYITVTEEYKVYLPLVLRGR
jgi:PKD repeat protein